MNRYALFFLTLISLHVHGMLLESTVEQVKKFFQIQEKLKEEFEKKFNKVAPTKDLKTLPVEQQNAVFALKNKCHAQMLNNLNKLDYKQVGKEVQREIAICIAQHAQVKAEEVVDTIMIPIRDILEKEGKDDKAFFHDLSKAKEKIGLITYELILRRAENSENCVSLFDGTAERQFRTDILTGLALKFEMNAKKQE